MARLRDVLTGRGRAFVASGTTLAAAGWGLGFPDISRVGVLLLVLPIVTGLISRRQRASLRVERHTSPSRVAVDERAIVTVTMTNAGTRRTPLLLAEERLNLALGDRPRFLLGQLGAGEVRQVEYAVRSHLRGRHPLGPLTVVLRDPFGLTNRFAEVGGDRRHRRAASHRPAGGRSTAGQRGRRGGRDPVHGRPARRGRPVDPRVPRRRRPPADPLAGDRPHGRPHGPPGGPAGPAPGDDPPRPAGRRPPGPRRLELVRVGGLRGRLGRHAPRRARLRHAPHLLGDGPRRPGRHDHRRRPRPRPARRGGDRPRAGARRAGPGGAPGHRLRRPGRRGPRRPRRGVVAPGGLAAPAGRERTGDRARHGDVRGLAGRARTPPPAEAVARRVDRWARRRAPTPSCCIPRAGRSPWPGRATASPRCGPH